LSKVFSKNTALIVKQPRNYQSEKMAKTEKPNTLLKFQRRSSKQIYEIVRIVLSEAKFKCFVDGCKM
jgi:hypothetical protein